MRDSDWSRENLLRSDWLGPTVALITTDDHDVHVKEVAMLVRRMG